MLEINALLTARSLGSHIRHLCVHCDKVRKGKNEITKFNHKIHLHPLLIFPLKAWVVTTVMVLMMSSGCWSTATFINFSPFFLHPPEFCVGLCSSPVVRYSYMRSAFILQDLLCLKVFSWCIWGERRTPCPPTPLLLSSLPTYSVTKDRAVNRCD